MPDDNTKPEKANIKQTEHEKTDVEWKSDKSQILKVQESAKDKRGA